MDRIDRKILDLLQQDASIRNNDLAERVGLAPSSCLRRVARLKELGIITKTIALTDPEKLGRGISAIVNVKLGQHGSKNSIAWLNRIASEQSVSQAYSVSGEIDAIVIFSLRSMKEFQELSKRLFADDDNVVQFVTFYVLDTHKFDLSN